MDAPPLFFSPLTSALTDCAEGDNRHWPPLVVVFQIRAYRAGWMRVGLLGQAALLPCLEPRRSGTSPLTPSDRHGLSQRLALGPLAAQPAAQTAPSFSLTAFPLPSTYRGSANRIHTMFPSHGPGSKRSGPPVYLPNNPLVRPFASRLFPFSLHRLSGNCLLASFGSKRHEGLSPSPREHHLSS